MKLNVSHFTPQILLLLEMENLELSDPKCDREGNQKTSQSTDAFVNSKRFKLP